MKLLIPIYAAALLGLFVSACSIEEAYTATQPDKGLPLFNKDLSNAIYPEGIWTVTDGVLTASEDQCIWTKEIYDNFVLDLEFRTEEGTNSGVIVYCSDTDNWIPNSIEIQIADDFADQWKVAHPNWHCGAIFGHAAPTRSAVKKPGEWNTYRITCQGQQISVELNGEFVNQVDISQWTSATTNPDGSDIPSWLSKPMAEMPTHGHIGFQGKHAGAPIYFRNLYIRKIAE